MRVWVLAILISMYFRHKTMPHFRRPMFWFGIWTWTFLDMRQQSQSVGPHRDIHWYTTTWPCSSNLLVNDTPVLQTHSAQSCTVQDLPCLLFVRNRRARHKVSEAGNTSPPTRRGIGTSACCKSPRTRSQLTTADTTPMCSCPSPSQTSSAKSSTRCYQKNSHWCGQT